MDCSNSVKEKEGDGENKDGTLSEGLVTCSKARQIEEQGVSAQYPLREVSEML